MRRIAIALGSLWAVQARAQDLTWEKLREAVLAHPGLAHERALVEERRGEGKWAGQAPVLRAELELENFAGTGGSAGLGGSNVGIWAGGDYRLGAVRVREKELAAAELSLQEVEPSKRRLELLWSARGTWEAWQEQYWRADLLDSLAAQALAVAEPLEAGRKVGRIAPWEVSLVQAEAAQWRNVAQAHRRKGRVLWGRLESWGISAIQPLGAGLPVLDTMTKGTAQSLDSLTLERERYRMQVQESLLAAQDRPVLSGAIGLLRDQASGDVGFGARVALPLPPWKRTGLETVRMRHQAVAMERRIALETRERALRLQGLREEMSAGSAELRTWEDEVIPRQELALAQVNRAQQTGAMDAAAVWTMRKALGEARIERLEKLIRVRELQRENRKLEGVEP